MENNLPSVYLGQQVDFFFPPEIPFDLMNDEQKVSYNYWKQYAEKHFIKYTIDEDKGIISNFQAFERPIPSDDPDLIKRIEYVNERRKGVFAMFFYFALVVTGIGYLFLLKETFSLFAQISCLIILLAALIFIILRYKHYYMHPNAEVVARVIILNEQKIKVGYLSHFSKAHWNKSEANQAKSLESGT